ncbi:hypothetical protein FDECE_18463, partial [Fusarium decemcellulare]
RRISCDRTEPQCSKCVAKGLKCSGLETRYRFTKGMATRGKWVGRTIQSVYQECYPSPAGQQQQGLDVPDGTKPEPLGRSKCDSKTSQPPTGMGVFGILDFGPRTGDVAVLEPTIEGVVSLDYAHDANSCIDKTFASPSETPRPDKQDLDSHELSFPFVDWSGFSSSEGASEYWDELGDLLRHDDPKTQQAYTLEAPDRCEALTFEIVPYDIASWKRELLLHYSESIGTSCV